MHVLNLDTKITRRIGHEGYFYVYSPYPPPSYAVSDDGVHVVEAGSSLLKIWRVDNTCRTDTTIIDMYGDEQCAYRKYSMSELGHPQGEHGEHTATNIQFAYGDDRLTYTYRTDDTIHRQIVIKPFDASSDKLEYLALGDSYTSGEGDIERKHDGSTYYLQGTEQPGQCHLSSRSYPFLLRNAWHIPEGSMRSVACSGAQVIHDYASSSNGYRGQNNRASNLANIKLQQVNALKKFQPGIVPQLEFVKKYQPSVVTVAGGGNDVGFAEILRYCASPRWSEVFLGDTCGYAVEGSPLKSKLYSAIDTQYSHTKHLLESIHHHSPKTRIILVGYPQFVKEASSSPCGLNAGFLNTDERNMINNAVRYMNDMLERAANDSGAEYGDIEDSLVGGRICEGSEYINGLTQIHSSDLISGRLYEAFHPNVKGHKRMADTILSVKPEAKLLMTTKTNFEPTEGGDVAVQRELISGGVISKANDTVRLTAEPYTFAENSDVTGAMYSKEIDLGRFTADTAGGLDIALKTKAMPIGNHVLLLSGKTPSGENLQVYQFVTVVADAYDGDDDGLPNESDPCFYIQHWYDEKTNEDICMAPSSSSPGTPVGEASLSTAILNLMSIFEEVATKTETSRKDESQSTEVSDETSQPKSSDRSFEVDSEKTSRPQSKLNWYIVASIIIAVVGGLVVVKKIRKK